MYKNLLYWMVAALVIFVFWSVSSRIQREERWISYSELLRQVESGSVSEVTISGSDAGTRVFGTFTNGRHFRTFAPPQAYGLVDRLLETGVEVYGRSAESTSWTGHLISWMPIVILIAFLVFFMRAGWGGPIDSFQWRLAAKARAVRALHAGNADLSDEEMMACLLDGARVKDRETEARKALYEMLAEGTVVVTAQKKYRLKTAP